MFLTRISVGQPVFATMMMLTLLVIGLFSYSRLPIEQLPDVDFPVVAVTATYAGASPEAVESDIVKPIEDAVSTLAGIDTIQSTARTGSALILMIFDLEIDSASAAQEVRDRIAQIERVLPENAATPQVLRFDPAEQPVMSIGISSPSLDPGSLTQLTEDVIAKRISSIPGVGRASVVGGAPREVQIQIDPDRQTALGVGIAEITGSLMVENQNLAAGAVTTQGSTQTVQVEGRISAIEDFEDIIVARRAGQPIRLGDVAFVTSDLAEPTSLAMLDGKRALALDVVKTQGANTVEVAEKIHKEIAKMQSENLFKDVSIEVVRDNAKPVVESFHAVESMMVEGAILATAIVFLFLNSWRSTVITGLTLPISIIGTMTVLYFLGFTLNMMTLMALSLAVGILIDDAIVVRENIMRHLHMGKTHRQAALEGTNEIGLAVLATTLSIVAVFLPVAFMEGIIGRFFLQFGVTVSVAVLISLFVSFTLDPMLSSVWYDPSAAPDAKHGPLGRMVQQFDRFFEWIAQLYGRLVRWSLKYRKTTLLIATLLLFGSFALFPKIGAEFVPPADNSEFQVDMVTPVGTSLERTAEKVAQVDALLRGFPEVIGTYATANSGTSSGDNRATIVARMVPPEERTRTPNDLTGPVREALNRIPGARYTVGAAAGLGGIAPPLVVNLSGDNLILLEHIADELAANIARIPGLVDVRTSLDDPQPTLGVVVDREAASDLGVSMQLAGNTLNTLLGGQTVGEWISPQGDSLDVVVRLPEDARDDVEKLGALPLAGGSSIIRLDQVAQFVTSESPGEISREDRLRGVKVTANLDGVAINKVMPEVQAAMDALDLPLGYKVSTGGDAEQIAETSAAAGAALLLAVTFIYIVLASQFGSFMQPFAIMTSLPLAIIGVLMGLLAFGSTLNMFSIIGFIMLMGLVVKNAILLVDNANQRRAEGMHLYDALVKAGLTRFRPIVMTTLAMIFGMLPLALNLHGGSGQNTSMAHAVIGGLISSSLLTLIVVPVILTYLDRFGAWIASWFTAPPEHVQ